jgi:hypothetical protein
MKNGEVQMCDPSEGANALAICQLIGTAKSSVDQKLEVAVASTRFPILVRGRICREVMVRSLHRSSRAVLDYSYPESFRCLNRCTQVQSHRETFTLPCRQTSLEDPNVRDAFLFKRDSHPCAG